MTGHVTVAGPRVGVLDRLVVAGPRVGVLDRLVVAASSLAPAAAPRQQGRGW